MLCICPSIHPKQSASSSASPAFTVSGPPFLPNNSQTPALDWQCTPSHARKSARVENNIASSTVTPPLPRICVSFYQIYRPVAICLR